MFIIALKDPIYLAIIQGVLEVLVLCVMVKVVVDSVYIYVFVGTGKGFPKERVVLLGISSMGRVYCKSFDWSQDSRMVRVCLTQSMVELVT